MACFPPTIGPNVHSKLFIKSFWRDGQISRTSLRLHNWFEPFLLICISLYRLVQLFANEWFHYYSAWKPKSKKYDKQLMATMQRGYHLWSTGTVTENSAVSGKRSWNVANIDSISI